MSTSDEHLQLIDLAKIHDRFHKICKSLSSHSGIFALFPLQNEYVSVICGTLKMIVQVSNSQLGSSANGLG